MLPAVEPVSAQGGGGRAGVGALAGHGGRPAAGRLPGAEAELDLDGLRPYRPGASASRIHWPAYARTGEMLERRLVAESESSPLVVLDSRRASSEESLDAAVRAAASLCVHLARFGGVGVLLPGDRRVTQVASDLVAWPAVHARLAVVEGASAGACAGHLPAQRRDLLGHGRRPQPLARRPQPRAGGCADPGQPASGAIAGRHLHGRGLLGPAGGSRLTSREPGAEERGMSAGAAPPPLAAPSPPAAAPGPEPGPPEQRDALPVRVAAFAALLAFAVGHWATLVSGPPALRMAALVVFLTAGGVALAWLGRIPMRRPTRALACAGVSVATLVGGMVITGLAVRLLWPGNWDDLADQLDRGLSAIHTVSWPCRAAATRCGWWYSWAAPLLGGIAAVLAFWPARRHGALLRGLALVSLLVLYGTAVTEHDLGRPLLRGAVLLLLVAAWLWLPRLAPREAATGTVAVLVVGFLALPLSAGLDADSPWWDYRSWNWFGERPTWRSTGTTPTAR